MKLTATTHHGDFRESVTIESTENILLPRVLQRLHRATAYGTRDLRVAELASMLAGLMGDGEADHGWTRYTLS